MSRKVSVMIVDDEEHIRRYMESIVNSLSCASVVAQADNGESALEQYAIIKPELILLDINMPKKNGIEVLAKIREKDQDTSIIIITSLSSIEMVKQSVALHAANYLLKDNPPEKIRDVIQKVCHERIHSNNQVFLP